MELLFAQADTFADAIALLKQYGPLVLVTAILLWQSWVRECRMNKRIVKLEDEQRHVLMPLVERLCGGPHNRSSVAQPVMWRPARVARDFRGRCCAGRHI